MTSLSISRLRCLSTVVRAAFTAPLNIASCGQKPATGPGYVTSRRTAITIPTHA